MILEVLAVQHRGPVDLDNGLLDLPPPGVQKPHEALLLPDFEEPLRGTQIGARV